jgi:hypothetical protein
VEAAPPLHDRHRVVDGHGVEGFERVLVVRLEHDSHLSEQFARVLDLPL